MPKIRTRKSIAKRIRLTGTGKVRRMTMYSGCKHIREKKSPKRVRAFRKTSLATPVDARNLLARAPYVK